MLSTKEAAKYLGVSEARVRQLILEGKLEAEKTGKSWLVSESSLLVRKETARNGRPPLSRAADKTATYLLMARNHEVARVVHSEGQGAFVRIEMLDASRAPYALVNYEAQNGHLLRNLNGWWAGRSIPDTRPEITTRLMELELQSAREIPLRSLGFSLSDQYWLKPQRSDLRWEKLNFFENDYDFGPLDGRSSLSIWLNAVGLSSPDNTSEGQLPKRWLVNSNGKRILIKSGGALGYEAVNEVVASRLYRRLLPSGEYVDYSLGHWRDRIVSVCETFVTAEEEFIPAVYIYGLHKKPNSKSRYIHYYDTCEELGASGAAGLLDKMIVCDCILANEDRHWRNFGIVRNVETLALRAAPIFDSGTSLWSSKHAEALKRGDYSFSTKPFFEDWQRQLNLVVDARWFDPDALDGFEDEVHGIYSKSMPGMGDYIDWICTGLAKRIAFAKSWYAHMPHPVFVGWTGTGPSEVVTLIDV